MTRFDFANSINRYSYALFFLDVQLLVGSWKIPGLVYADAAREAFWVENYSKPINTLDGSAGFLTEMVHRQVQIIATGLY